MVAKASGEFFEGCKTSQVGIGSASVLKWRVLPEFRMEVASSSVFMATGMVLLVVRRLQWLLAVKPPYTLGWQCSS